MEPLVIDWAKEEAKMAVIFMFIANNSIFSRLYNNLFSQVNSAEEVLPDDEFWGKIHFTVFKRSVKYKFDSQTLTKCEFLKGRLSKYFFWKYVPMVVSKPHTKFSAASIVKNYHPRTSLIDNIFVQFGGRLFRQVIGVPMRTNVAPLLADLLLYLYQY